MKKLKFMLLSFALLAIVGGALAFKAKFTTLYCTAPVNDATISKACAVDAQHLTIPKACNIQQTGRLLTNNIKFGVFCYTTATDGDGDGTPDCVAQSCFNVTTPTSIYND